MRKVYLSGPMTGLPEHNHPAFRAAATALRKGGITVINPAEINSAAGKDTWAECLRRDIIELCGCDTIVLMPGWEHSSGAHLELHIAHRIGMDVRLFQDAMNTLGDEVNA